MCFITPVDDEDADMVEAGAWGIKTRREAGGGICSRECGRSSEDGTALADILKCQSSSVELISRLQNCISCQSLVTASYYASLSCLYD